MKTILVTGSTDGIGWETARELLALGHWVLVHGRSREKAARAAEGFRKKMPLSRVEPVWGDLSSMSEVAQLAGQVAGLAPSLDVLLNNAGLYPTRRQMTRDGIELTMAVNHFAVQLLTLRLLENLKKAKQGRVVTVSSMAHGGGKIDLDDMNFERSFSSYGAYAASKLANILFTKALAKRLNGTAVTANCLHPGVIDTKLLRAGFAMGGRSLEEGAKTPVYLALDEGLSKATGKYYSECREATPSREALDDKLGEALWDYGERLLRPFM